MNRVCDQSFDLSLELSNAPSPFGGLVVRASGDPLRSTGAFVVYEHAASTHYGYIQTRLATDVRGVRWGMGLLYDVPPTADATPPSSGESVSARFAQRAEIEFRYA